MLRCRAGFAGLGRVNGWCPTSALIPIVTKFGEKLSKKFLLPPIEPPPQEELLSDGDQFPCKISWIQTDQDNNASTCANEL